jgi:hypothetical protein
MAHNALIRLAIKLIEEALHCVKAGEWAGTRASIALKLDAVKEILQTLTGDENEKSS